SSYRRLRSASMTLPRNQPAPPLKGRHSNRLDRVPRELNPLLATQQLQQHEHPFMRTQSGEQANRLSGPPITRTRMPGLSPCGFGSSLTWWLGDMIGALVVTPLVVLCALSDARVFRRTELTKSAAVISLAVAVGFIAFNPLFKQSQHPDTLGFLAVLPLLWAALRRGPRDPPITPFILPGFSIWGTLSAAGPFAPASLNDSLLFVLVFLISVSVPSLALSADVAMRKTIEENLRRTHTELDRRVEMRTAELAAANQALRDEVSRRAGTEKEALEQ